MYTESRLLSSNLFPNKHLINKYTVPTYKYLLFANFIWCKSFKKQTLVQRSFPYKFLLVALHIFWFYLTLVGCMRTLFLEAIEKLFYDFFFTIDDPFGARQNETKLQFSMLCTCVMCLHDFFCCYSFIFLNVAICFVQIL